MFTDVQETAIIDMVIRNNGIKLTEIRVLADNVNFDNIHCVSITTISRVLKKHQIMKQWYTVPFERNSERVKQLRNQYVQVRSQYVKYRTVFEQNQTHTKKKCG